MAASSGRADSIIDISEDSAAPFDISTYPVIFPNWKFVPASSYLVYECDDVTCAACTASSFTGVTIFNFGSATGGAAGDITGVYWKYVCAGGASAVQTLTYAGVWSGNPAWTWAGSVALPNDACGTCGCFGSLQLYADIKDCPTAGSTVALGPAFDPVSARGGVTDTCGTSAPGSLLSPSPRAIQYLYKTRDQDVAAPGDTITYTVYYARPGSAALTNEWVTDTLPAYTHYVGGSAAPPADAGFDPDWGPPIRLRWTLPGGATTGGPTGAVSFTLSVDWGNGEGFEPGSGDVAAPEGASLDNQAHLSWAPSTCPPGQVSNVVGTTVRRFLFWEIGDNDVLFAPKYGSPDDEMTYSIFIKNTSATKIWWNVSLWDTVPSQLDPWLAGEGFDDPCAGWTMTPGGCAAASPGYKLAGPATVMTWKLDMPPSMTLEMRWKAKVKPTTLPNSTAISVVSVMELGKPGIIGGTGHQGVPKNFVHLANIILRTTYLSYVSVSTINSLGQDGLFTDFYPLNKATNFEFRGIEYAGVPYATAGGVSDTIGCLIGDCLGGFAGSAGCALGSGAIPGGGIAGCKAERIPAVYAAYAPVPTVYGDCTSSTVGTNPTIPYHLLYKVVSNSPVLWQELSGVNDTGNDQFTYDPTTSLSYSGFIVYGFLRHGTQATAFDMVELCNTSVGPTDTLDPTLATTVHLFYWDYATLTWIWWNSYEVGPEAMVLPYGFQDVACNRHYRVVSSQTKLVAHHGWCSRFGPDANNLSHMSPTRNSGMLISGTPGEAFYLFPGPWDSYADDRVLVTNAGAANATYRIERYQPRNPVAIAPSGNCAGVPLWLSDTYGSWLFIKRDSVPAGFYNGNFTPPNPHVYGTMYDVPIFDAPGNSAGLWRIVLESGGPIQCLSGGDIMAVWSGGSVLHPSIPLGKKVGTEFWLSEPWEWAGTGCNGGPSINSIAVFCPKTGMTAQCVTNEGYSAMYTTNGPDQCIAFRMFTLLATGQKRNTKVTVTGGDAMVNYNHCIKNHKIFTAPFMETGVHYDVIAPPVVYIGQSFWITVIVVDNGGGTKVDYCGTASFTSTDPGAKIGGTGMDQYNYTYTTNTGGSCPVCGGGCDRGLKIFVNVTMTDLGMQSIVVQDTGDGSITGLTTVMVVGVDVKLTKQPSLQVSASGDTVQFRVCWSNYSSASAFTFVITDAVPQGTVFLPEAGTAAFNCGSTDGVAIGVGFSTSAVTTPPAAFTTGNPTAGTYWLRFTVPVIGIETTGCACYRVTVN